MTPTLTEQVTNAMSLLAQCGIVPKRVNMGKETFKRLLAEVEQPAEKHALVNYHMFMGIEIWVDR